MARPKQNRQVSTAPKVTYFKPRGIPLVDLEEVRLSVEELEALRLADLEGLPCCEACRLMGISRHTFGRVLGSARRAVAEALVVGKALRIEGGNWVFAEPHTGSFGLSGNLSLSQSVAIEYSAEERSDQHLSSENRLLSPLNCQALNKSHRSCSSSGPEEEKE